MSDTTHNMTLGYKISGLPLLSDEIQYIDPSWGYQPQTKLEKVF